MNYNNTIHRRAQSNNDFQQVICARIAGLVEDEYQQQKIDPKRINLGSTLFQIPEQNDLISSVEQTTESSKQHSQMIKDLNMSNVKPTQQQDKENFKNLSSCSTLINQIQQIVKSGSNTKELQSKKPFNSTNEATYKKSSTQSQMSFTKVLQKNKDQIICNTNKAKHLNKMLLLTEKEVLLIVTNQPIKNNPMILPQMTYQLFYFLFLIILSGKTQNKKNSNSDTCDSYRNMEVKMKKIEKEISTIKLRQDQLDDANRNIQDQLKEFIYENKQQQEYGSKQLKKIEQLEQITKRNEESICYLKNFLVHNNQNNKRNDQNNMNFGNIQQSDITDLQKKFADFRPINHKVY
ncbi:unnamed protein product (macronuclear) [Paramecium tetraurelia]|uniref:Uncharacterized protein n=1 Tax=Paramecium tetraurelia TaxID=5888 RepID=A0CV41_PARTE|nr:uncharacterized protein GSPATT00010826001 [Paramecium tetraurelia]CAK74658.1 unnamed protein product [Paramecium tetraurelia]|eukprot:XP_001442055.1 hypothetical protein (macronuclear) [Paramecium tetraurelia strain d4-2]